MTSVERPPTSDLSESAPVSQLTFQLRQKAGVSASELEALQALYTDAYNSVGLYIGLKMYSWLTFPTTTQIATLHDGKALLAAANLNGARIGMIASKNGGEDTKRGLVGQLVTQIQQTGIDPWMTIATDRKAYAMLAAVTTPHVNVSPVDDPSEVRRLFREQTTLSTPRDFRFMTVEHEFLRSRLRKKGTPHDGKFLAVTAVPSLHGPDHSQIVFQ